MKAAGAAFMASPAPFASLSRTRTVSWSGHSWRIRPASWGGLPGPNRWSARNVTVRDGILRLAITRTRGRWTCAEIQSVQSFGYGRYTFVVNSDLAHLDPWVVLGLFTYADDQVARAQRDRHRGRQVGPAPRSEQRPVRAAALSAAGPHPAHHAPTASSVHDVVRLDAGPDQLGDH